jgi:hypothetical protein
MIIIIIYISRVPSTAIYDILIGTKIQRNRGPMATIVEDRSIRIK